MDATIPITLIGENLGKRHFYFNSIVNETQKRGEDFDKIIKIKEQSPIDRLFKIDLASKNRNVEFIFKNLKDDDMLFVSRALKSTWLMETEYEPFINPNYLEDNVYPKMITTAVTKMQHWIHKNLKDEARCQQFYNHYKETHFKLAVKFLVKCSKKYIENEFGQIVQNISPHYFKILCEKCPKVATLFFDLVSKDDAVKNMYLDRENEYFNTLRYLLKTDGDIVLNITEMYYDRNVFKEFSPVQTKCIMKKYKQRFLQKPELYTGWLLNTQAVADSLSVEEAKDIVLKLVRAKYLAFLGWSSYKKLEPFIKRIKPNERAEFKKKVFVTKDIGDEQGEWPYETPSSPVRENGYPTIFDDRQPQPHEYEKNFGKRKIKKKYAKCGKYCEIVSCEEMRRVKTLLDKLFDEYRFVSFEQTLYDLRKRIKAESSPQNREFILLVLVSKSGGRPDAIASLLELLDQHNNEPSNVRAAVIRSLVKRSQVWRLPEVSWNQLLKFGKGLGLDGGTAETDCYEGLHAVVIRSLLFTGECIPSIQNSFLDQFSTLSDYSLNVTEKKRIGETLPKMLLSIAIHKENVSDAVECVGKVIDTLNAYKIKVETYPSLLNVVLTLAEKDISNATPILTTLFESKVGRKQLFRYTFGLFKTDASYVNALRHDTTVLDGKTFALYCGNRTKKNADKFLTKLSLYFGESNGLSNTFLTELKNSVFETESYKLFGRPLAILLKEEIDTYIKTISTIGDQKSKVLAAAINSNSHKTRPLVDITKLETEHSSTKQIANKLIVCRAIEVNAYVEELSKHKRTVRLAFTLSKRTSRETEVFEKLALLRPTVAIKVALKLMNMQGSIVSPMIWETVRPIIEKFDITKAGKEFVIKHLGKINNICIKIRPEYSVVIYNVFIKMPLYAALPPLCHVEILLPKVNESFIENLLRKFLQEDFGNNLSTNLSDVKSTCLFIRILIKYLLTCKNEIVQNVRFEEFGIPFLQKLGNLNISGHSELFQNYLSEMLLTLRYCKVFLDLQYVSPIPVIEKIVIWLQTMLTMVDNFNLFSQLHLTMLFCKALRQCVASVPDIFADEKRKRNEGVKIFSNLFGKYIAREVKSLTNEYFESIIEIYNEHIINYLETYTVHVSSEFFTSLIKGIFEESKGIEHVMGIFLLRNKYWLKDEHTKELYKYMNELNHSEIQWFLHN